MKQILAIVFELIKKKFHGRLTIRFQNGNIVHIEEYKSIEIEK
jgi:hypothetical protein